MNNKIINNIISLIKKYSNPESGKPFEINKNINIIVKDGHANITINIDPKNIKLFENLRENLQKEILSLPDIISSNVILTSEGKVDNPTTNNKYKLSVKNIIAISSGKGGVGKSTVAVNLAIALKTMGHSVSLLDADIYGPSIPKMMGILKKPDSKNNKIIPIENYGIKCMSIGFLIDPDTPTIWRGPMIMKALEQLFTNVEWGDQDYMIVDLPPGTGDTQLTMAQKVPLKGAVIVSTPQDVALIDVRKGINMFKKVNVPVLGIVENMSYFICDKCNKRHEIFSHGGAKKEAARLKTDFLGEIPIVTSLRESSDQGKPITIQDSKAEVSTIYTEIAKKISQKFI